MLLEYIFLALQSQRSALSKAVLYDSLITVDSTSLQFIFLFLGNLTTSRPWPTRRFVLTPFQMNEPSLKCLSSGGGGIYITSFFFFLFLYLLINLLSYFFVKKIPLSRRVEYVMDGSTDQ